MLSLRLIRHVLPLLALSAAALPAAADDAVQFLDDNGATGVNLTFFNGSTYVTDNGVGAGNYHLSVNGTTTTAFCTDLWDEVSDGESWNATVHQTSAPDGLASATYYKVAPQNITAVDFIGQNYTTSGDQAAAQLAIWDLVVGGHVSQSGPGYQWSGLFQETSGSVSLGDVFAIEQAALGASGPQGSEWLQVVPGSQTPGTGRPQDFVTAAPEPSPAAVFGLAGGGVLGLLLRARRRPPVG